MTFGTALVSANKRLRRKMPEPQRKLDKFLLSDPSDRPGADRPDQVYLFGSAVRPAGRHLAGHLGSAGSCVRLTCFPLSIEMSRR